MTSQTLIMSRKLENRFNRGGGTLRSFAVIPHLNLEQQLFHGKLLLIFLSPVSMLIKYPLNTLISLQHTACESVIRCAGRLNTSPKIKT